MPSSLVKTPADEKLWSHAKEISEKQNPDNVYALATHIFKNMKKHKKKKAFYEILREAAKELNKDKLLEDLSSLEHSQWEGWAKSKVDEVSRETAEKWKKNFVPYEDLPEDIKELDRPFARKVIKVLEKHRLLP